MRKVISIAIIIVVFMMSCKTSQNGISITEQEALVKTKKATIRFKGADKNVTWKVDITDSTIVYNSVLNPEGYVFTEVKRETIMDIPGIGYSGTDIYGNKVRVEVIKKDCQDDMLEKTWPFEVRVSLEIVEGKELGESAIYGCGEFIADPRLNQTWYVESYKGKTVPVINPEKQPILKFITEKGMLHANMGCNGITGQYELMEYRMYFSPNFMMTEMYCEGLMELEHDFSKMIAGNTFEYQFRGDQLIFSDLNGVELLILSSK